MPLLTARPSRRLAVYKLLNLQPGEERTVLLFSLYSLLMGAAVAVYYTCTTSLFLTNFSREQLPLSFVAGGLFVLLMGQAVRRLQQHFSFEQVSTGLLLFMLFAIGSLLLLGQLTSSKWVYFALFLWNRGFVFVHGIVFWATMGRVLNLGQAKRLFGLIGLGDVMASMVSYLSVPVLLKLVSPEQLLLLAFGFLVICAGLMSYIRQQYRAALASPRPQAQAASRSQDAPPAVNRTYQALLFTLSLLPVAGLVCVEFMFTVLSKQVYPSKESLASFLGLFFGICSIIELVIKIFLYNRLIQRFTIRIGIVLLPLLLLFSYTLATVYGTAYGVNALFFAFIALSRFFMSAVRRGISDPAFQVLFQPVPAAERTQLQSRIEGVPKALGNILPGLLFIALAMLGLSSMVILSYLLLPLLGYWLYTAFRIHGEYRTVLSDAVTRSVVATQPTLPAATIPAANLAGPAASYSFEEASRLASSERAADRVLAADLLGRSGRFHAYRHLLRLLDDPAPAVREAAIRAAGELRKPELWPRLLHYLGDTTHQDSALAALLAVGEPAIPALTKHFQAAGLPVGVQDKITHLMGHFEGEAATRFLRASLAHPSQRVREQAIAGLARRGHRATTPERQLLLSQLHEQVALLVWLAATRLDMQPEYATNSALLQTLRQEKQCVVLHLFRLLAILYGDQQFAVIGDLIMRKDQEIQGFLLELLATILPEEVKADILPLFAHAPLAEKVQLSAERYPQQQLSPEARLHDIINQDYTRLSPHMRAAALWELLVWHQQDSTLLLVANTMTPEAVVAETALYVLRLLHPARFSSLYQAWQAQSQMPHLPLAERIDGGLPEEELLLRQYDKEAASSAAALVLTS
jgi:AAA family ATP:ADP antiporter